jgi:hypothetical protein
VLDLHHRRHQLHQPLVLGNAIGLIEHAAAPRQTINFRQETFVVLQETRDTARGQPRLG